MNRGGALAIPSDKAKLLQRNVNAALRSKKVVLEARLKPIGIDPARLAAIAQTAVFYSPQLLALADSQAGIDSLLGSVLELAKAGLEPDSIEAAIVPYKGKATPQVMFQGAMKIARRSDKVTQVWTEVVRENDAFSFSEGTHPEIKFERGEGDEKARGTLTHAFACARFADGYVQFRVIDRDEVNRAKLTGRSTAWNTHEGEMWKKTAIKRLCKLLPRPDQGARLIQLDDKVEAGREVDMGEEWRVVEVTDETPQATDTQPDDISTTPLAEDIADAFVDNEETT